MMTRKDEIKQKRGEIKEMASRIKMRYEQTEEEMDVGMEWVDISPNVRTVRCSLSSETCTVLNVRFSKGGHIPRHAHPERREDIYVIDGSLRDVANNVDLVVGDHYAIPAGLPHEFESDYALITITFRPPYPEVEPQV